MHAYIALHTQNKHTLNNPSMILHIPEVIQVTNQYTGNPLHFVNMRKFSLSRSGVVVPDRKQAPASISSNPDKLAVVQSYTLVRKLNISVSNF